MLAASVSQSEFSYPMLVPTIMRYADDKRCGLRYLSDKWMMNGIILTIDSWIIFNEYTLFQDCSRHFLTTIWGTDGQPPRGVYSRCLVGDLLYRYKKVLFLYDDDEQYGYRKKVVRHQAGRKVKVSVQ